jgi:hypothetical protein
VALALRSRYNPLKEEPILSLGKLRTMRTFFVVHDGIDPIAYGIAAHQQGIADDAVMLH